jgi:hypothetical protein
MFSDTSDVVIAFAKILLPPESGNNKILPITLDIIAGGKNVTNDMQRVIFLFHRPDGDMRVLWNTTQFSDETYANFEDWEIRADRDFVWDNFGVRITLRDFESKMQNKLGRGYYKFTANLSSLPSIVTIKDFHYAERGGRVATIKW